MTEKKVNRGNVRAQRSRNINRCHVRGKAWPRRHDRLDDSAAAAAIIYERRKFYQEVTLPNSNFLLATTFPIGLAFLAVLSFLPRSSQNVCEELLKISGEKKKERKRR